MKEVMELGPRVIQQLLAEATKELVIKEQEFGKPRSRTKVDGLQDAMLSPKLAAVLPTIAKVFERLLGDPTASRAAALAQSPDAEIPNMTTAFFVYLFTRKTDCLPSVLECDVMSVSRPGLPHWGELCV